MSRYIHLFLVALGISFAGSLPIGTLNVSVANLVIDMKWAEAVEFAIGAILVEVILVRIALVTVKRLERMKHLFRLFGLIAGVALLLLSWVSLEAAWHMQKPGAVFPIASQHPFLSGLFLSLINPLHLPFWMGWTTVLKSKGLLDDSAPSYNVFVAAIGAGTSLAFLAYGFAGNLLIGFLQRQQNLLNWAVGIALLIAGLAQLYKLTQPKPVA
jgi:threonine/homoserine/homoserine lactone efflux protein